ncbi:MAG: SCO family protein [Alphaproteobacteria bacterium]|nr:MAG: SCO family protein [Alphaproteobacteria bacterium]
MKIIFTILAVLTGILVALAAYLFTATPRSFSPSLPASSGTQTRFTQPFTLVNHNGDTVTEQTYLGKPTLWFFGFTHCPDVCPTTLGALTGWLNQLGDDAQKFNVVFVSVDPERDTPASLKDYIAMFHPQVTAATGTEEQLQGMTKQFMVYYAKVPVKEGQNPADYLVSHSSGILMADATGTFKGMLDAHDPDAEALEKLRSLIK